MFLVKYMQCYKHCKDIISPLRTRWHTQNILFSSETYGVISQNFASKTKIQQTFNHYIFKKI
jgi:hypothetical protein